MDAARRVLHLEDDARDRELVRHRLEELGPGTEIVHARNAQEYEAALRGLAFDIILADYRLPTYDGLSALVLARTLRPDTPFIFVSGTMGEDAAIQGLTEGATDYVLKERLARLVPAVRRALYEAENRRERQRAEEKERQLLSELLASEARYRSMFENSPLGICRTTFDGRFLDVNPALVRMLGYEAADDLVREIEDIGAQIYPSAQDREALLSEQLQTDTTQHLQRFRRKDGSEFVANLYLRTVRDAEGHPLHLEGVFEDITRRKHAEDALLASERRKGILNDIANAFLTLADDEVYAEVLGIIHEALGTTRGVFGFVDEAGSLVVPSLRRHPWAQPAGVAAPVVFRPDVWEEHGWAVALRERRSHRCAQPFVPPGGEVRIDDLLAVPLQYAERAVGLIAIANPVRPFGAEADDTLASIVSFVSPILAARVERDWQERKRKQAEEALRMLSRAVEQSPASIIVTDTDGRIEYVNPKFSRVTGYEAAEVVGRNPRVLKSGEMSEEEYERLWATIASGREWRGEFLNRRKNGELYWELASISPIFDAEGQLTHYLAIKEDITDYKRLQEDLRQAQKMEAFGQLAGGVAHDFNNLLTVIQMNVSMLKESSLTAEQSTGLDEIASAAGRAANLTRQLLTFSRRHRPNPTVLDLNDLVANVTRMLQRVIGEHISLTAHYAPGAARVHADRGMIEQALMNLAINARDAMPKGGRVSIGTEIVEVDEHAARANPRAYPGTFVRLRVSDTGHGIPSDILPRIFEPFFTTKGVGHGTGLGLAIVFGIVDQHRGWIETESRMGEGTTFRLYLPAATAPLAEDAQGGGDRPELRGTETVLLVEDEPSLRSALQKVLEQHGYRVLQASTAREAIEVWRREEQKIDLLLTDVVMPDEVTGRELADRLHADAPGLKVIYASGHSDEVLPDGSALRASPDFIEKPFMPEDLLRKVRDRLDRR